MGYLGWALLALCIWSLVAIQEKVVVGTRGMDPLSYLVLTYLLGCCIFPLLLFFPLTLPSLSHLLLLLACGVLIFLGMLYYLRAIQIEEISRVVPLWNLISVYVVILSHMTLGEELSLKKWIAFILLVGGGFTISLERIGGIVKLRKAFFLMLIPTFLIAIHEVVIKYISLDGGLVSGRDILFMVRIGSSAGALAVLAPSRFRRRVFGGCRGIGRKWLLIIVAGVVANQVAWFSHYEAITLGDVSIVSSLSGVVSLLILVLSVLTTRFFPLLLKEDITPRILVEKTFSIVLILTGLAILYLWT